MFKHEKSKPTRSTVDISAALENCFFHSLALYYLLTKRPFPNDLFVEYETDLPEVKNIKQFIPNVNSLNLFAIFARQCQNIEDPPAPHFLFEKTLVLGVLLRSWFVKELHLDKEHMGLRFAAEEAVGGGVNELNITFISLIKGYREACLNPKKEMLSFEQQVKDNAIYEANKVFFNHQIDPFNVSDDKIEEIARTYWHEQGYARYCVYLNQQVKVSYADFCTILTNKLDLPFALFNHLEASCIYTNSNDPKFLVSLDAQSGHYFLRKTADMSAQLLEEYATQILCYERSREDLLRIGPGHAEKLSSLLLLPATIPQQFGKNPLIALSEQIEKIAKSLEHQDNDELIERQPWESSDDNELLEKQALPTLSRYYQRKENHLYFCISQMQLKKIDYAKNKLLEKDPLGKKKYEDAETAAGELHTALLASFDNFRAEERTPETYQILEKSFTEAIAKHRAVLAHHRDAYQLIGNIIGAVIGLGVIYGFVIGINYLYYGRVTFFQTDGEQKVDDIMDACLDIGSMFNQRK